MAGGNPDWKPGCPSPNPSGRPRGIVDRRMRVTQALMEDAEAVARVVLECAKNGDVAAAALVLARVAPALKNQAERVSFSFDAKAPMAQQIESVLQAVADGDVSVDIANQIIAAINTLAGVRAAEGGGDEETTLVKAFREFATKVPA